MVLHRKIGGNHYAGGAIDEHKQAFDDRFGQLPVPSSLPGTTGRPRSLVRKRASYLDALKSAIAWLLTIDRSEHGASKLRNTLNGTQGIIEIDSNYRVYIIKQPEKTIWATFAWGNPSRETLKGHPDHPPVFFDSKEKAFKAAVAKSRELRRTGAVTLDNLKQRFMDKSADNGPGTIKVDEGIPGLKLSWASYRGRVKFVAYSNIKKVLHTRSYEFGAFPESQETDDDDEAESDAVRVPEVTATNKWETVEMTAAEFAGLSTLEKARHRLPLAEGFEYPEAGVPVNPYFLGLWLGDGDRSSTTIANNHEKQITEFLAGYAAELDLHFVWHGYINYAIVGTSRVSHRPLPPSFNPGMSSHMRTEMWARLSILSRRIAAGWKMTPSDNPETALSWQAPLEDIEKRRDSLWDAGVGQLGEQ